MVKADPNRDYYADLDLPPTADISDIKKQFRKLALKYHPDRNPGKEGEVNAKFQTIQSAHEILIDPEQKAKYDAIRARSSSRYPRASGVKGNPWQNAADPFPPPPRRAAAAGAAPRNSTAPSGASKYRGFAPNVPPTAKAQAKEDPTEVRRKAWEAFEQMRPSAHSRTSQTQQPSTSKPEARDTKHTGPQPVPRTPSQRQRQEAAFGTRKSGYYPRSPAPGDEPPVTTKNYATSRHTSNLFHETAAGTRRRRGSSNADPNVLDPRQSTPYQGVSGEKTNPFDGVPPVRTGSTREPRSEREESSDKSSTDDQRQRSSSVPRGGQKDGPNGTRFPKTSNRPNTSTEGATNAAGASSFASRSRASSRYTPNDRTNDPLSEATTGFSKGAPPPSEAKDTEFPSVTKTNNTTPMYDPLQPMRLPPSSHPAMSEISPPHISSVASCSAKSDATRNQEIAHATSEHHSCQAPYPIQSVDPELTPFERRQRELLTTLIGTPPSLAEVSETPTRKPHAASDPYRRLSCANDDNSNSFSFSADDNRFKPSTKGQSRFARNSSDGISTRFVQDEDPNAYQFSAGNGPADPPTKPRSKSGSRLGRQSPVKAKYHRQRDNLTEEQAGTSQADGAFDPKVWSEIGPQSFAPQQSQGAGVSPIRPVRSNSKKPKSVKPTMGNAGLINEETSSSEEDGLGSHAADNEPDLVDSPNAMDIDTPPPERSTGVKQAPAARNIPVEPSKPEWRTGDISGLNGEGPQEAGRPKPFRTNAAGSEDSEEFRASFADFKFVPPFAPQAAGLGSFGDMKINLPFDSQASGRVPIKNEEPQRPLVFPAIPQAPKTPQLMVGGKPSAADWQTYTQQFQQYLFDWDTFNAEVVEHFSTRQTNFSHSHRSKGCTDTALREQLVWMRQDQEVRRKWAMACAEYEKHVRDFMTIKAKTT